MRETVWRSRLVEQFKQRKDDSFIWVHDAKFKAGFPDMYVVLHGISHHFELKVTDIRSHEFEFDASKLFRPLQIHTMRQITKAGGNAKGLVRANIAGEVGFFLVNFGDQPTTSQVLNRTQFAAWWLGSDLFDF